VDHIEQISVEDLHQVLDEVEGKKPTLRLTVAIAYKNGVPQTDLAEWYGVQRRTIYSWLKRLEQESLAEAARDDHRSGRPRKLSEKQQAQFEDILQDPPTAVGYDAPAWTPGLVQQYLADTFEVDYSHPSCRRLMKEVGCAIRGRSGRMSK